MKKLLLILAFSNPAFALYDFAAINTIPDNDQVSFCLEYDTRKADLPSYVADNLYIAAVAKPAGEILFVEATLDGINVNPMPSSGNAPVFSKWHSNSEPTCLGPFPKPALQDFSIYAGLGDSLEDVMQRSSVVKFFDGFPELPPPEKAWTVMVYVVGSDLEAKPKRKEGHHWASKDIIEMLEGTTNTSTNLVITTGGSTRNGWDTVKRSFIQNGQQYVLEDLGAKSMAEPQTLSDFVTWAKTQFPAQHYALILWNHGGGTQGFGQDSSLAGNKKMMSFTELHQAYQTIREQIGSPLDIVIYDACLMASIEVAEITATVANAMAGSAELEPGHGIDYAQILRSVGQSSPADGIDFGKVVKTGYIKHAENKGTLENSQITYSVFDLTQLPAFTKTFSAFAEEFNKLLKRKDFLNYKNLSRGIIRAPGYPLVQTGQLRSLRSMTTAQHIRVDFYNLLQTVGPNLDGFSQQAADLLEILDKLVVDYEINDSVQKINPQAGRISIDINTTNTTHLSSLSEAHNLFNEGLSYYDEKRREDGFIPDGKFICPRGLTCAFAQWLELEADDILGVEAYYGQKSADISTVYLIDPAFYQHKELTETLELKVDGHQACQYQLCVSDSECEDITLTQQGNQLLADISLNDSPAVLSFCKNDDQWLACGVAQQIEGIWGRDELLYAGDNIVPSTLLMQTKETELRQGNALTISTPANVSLKTSCDEEKATIWAIYYSLNQQKQTEILCDSGDCFCQPDDAEPGCQEIGFKAGVYLAK